MNSSNLNILEIYQYIYRNVAKHQLYESNSFRICSSHVNMHIHTINYYNFMSILLIHYLKKILLEIIVTHHSITLLDISFELFVLKLN